ncbi:hypothetical protein EX30DRAFT_365584 [Ascodesmis nigricans]|uniref:DUF6604 domain-containing protein n=1 Tax=Ascodesmis nigricans TaxID=341454 RepID=A0A4S2MSH1_9PEZI|nr:hypothetical protein EX30DRAFT_365584 [Ascodesmis nigricans]
MSTPAASADNPSSPPREVSEEDTQDPTPESSSKFTQSYTRYKTDLQTVLKWVHETVAGLEDSAKGYPELTEPPPVSVLLPSSKISSNQLRSYAKKIAESSIKPPQKIHTSFNHLFMCRRKVALHYAEDTTITVGAKAHRRTLDVLYGIHEMLFPRDDETETPNSTATLASENGEEGDDNQPSTAEGPLENKFLAQVASQFEAYGNGVEPEEDLEGFYPPLSMFPAEDYELLEEDFTVPETDELPDDATYRNMNLEIAVTFFFLDLADLRSYLNQEWREAEPVGKVDTPVAAIVSNVAVAAIKQLASELFLEFSESNATGRHITVVKDLYAVLDSCTQKRKLSMNRQVELKEKHMEHTFRVVDELVKNITPAHKLPVVDEISIRPHGEENKFTFGSHRLHLSPIERFKRDRYLLRTSLSDINILMRPMFPYGSKTPDTTPQGMHKWLQLLLFLDINSIRASNGFLGFYDCGNMRDILKLALAEIECGLPDHRPREELAGDSHPVDAYPEAVDAMKSLCSHPLYTTEGFLDKVWTTHPWLCGSVIQNCLLGFWQSIAVSPCRLAHMALASAVWSRVKEKWGDQKRTGNIIDDSNWEPHSRILDFLVLKLDQERLDKLSPRWNPDNSMDYYSGLEQAIERISSFGNSLILSHISHYSVDRVGVNLQAMAEHPIVLFKDRPCACSTTTRLPYMPSSDISPPLPLAEFNPTETGFFSFGDMLSYTYAECYPVNLRNNTILTHIHVIGLEELNGDLFVKWNRLSNTLYKSMMRIAEELRPMLCQPDKLGTAGVMKEYDVTPNVAFLAIIAELDLAKYRKENNWTTGQKRIQKFKAKLGRCLENEGWPVWTVNPFLFDRVGLWEEPVELKKEELDRIEEVMKRLVGGDGDADAEKPKEKKRKKKNKRKRRKKKKKTAVGSSKDSEGEKSAEKDEDDEEEGEDDISEEEAHEEEEEEEENEEEEEEEEKEITETELKNEHSKELELKESPPKTPLEDSPQALPEDLPEDHPEDSPEDPPDDPPPETPPKDDPQDTPPEPPEHSPQGRPPPRLESSYFPDLDRYHSLAFTPLNVPLVPDLVNWPLVRPVFVWMGDFLLLVDRAGNSQNNTRGARVLTLPEFVYEELEEEEWE